LYFAANCFSGGLSKVHMPSSARIAGDAAKNAAAKTTEVHRNDRASIKYLIYIVWK
jgi:hypothetical protein